MILRRKSRCPLDTDIGLQARSIVGVFAEGCVHSTGIQKLRVLLFTDAAVAVAYMYSACCAVLSCHCVRCFVVALSVFCIWQIK